ncbi:hypothetical protein [Nocardioides marinquilinus]
MGRAVRRSDAGRGRLLAVVAAGVVCGLVLAGLLRWSDDASGPAAPASSRPAPAPPGEPAPAGQAREVLRTWDAARAAAWRRGDTGALAALYTPGSVAGEHDVAMLHAWNQRGRRVTAMTTQVLDVRVLEREPGRLVLRVTDRLARVEAGDVVLPSDRPSTHHLALRRDPRDPDAEWQVAWVLSRAG